MFFCGGVERGKKAKRGGDSQSKHLDVKVKGPVRVSGICNLDNGLGEAHADSKVAQTENGHQVDPRLARHLQGPDDGDGVRGEEYVGRNVEASVDEGKLDEHGEGVAVLLEAQVPVRGHDLAVEEEAAQADDRVAHDNAHGRPDGDVVPLVRAEPQKPEANRQLEEGQREDGADDRLPEAYVHELLVLGRRLGPRVPPEARTAHQHERYPTPQGA